MCGRGLPPLSLCHHWPVGFYLDYWCEYFCHIFCKPSQETERLGVKGQLGPPWSPLKMSAWLKWWLRADDDDVSANPWSTGPQIFCLLPPLNNLLYSMGSSVIKPHRLLAVFKQKMEVQKSGNVEMLTWQSSWLFSEMICVFQFLVKLVRQIWD